ncbi:MAG: hypothetical protein IJW83_05115 [Clostridia bacterium]|nr:hypothetical protein [Clostridia bacterium]
MKKRFSRSPYALEQMTPSEREARIQQLETERLAVVREIETKMRLASKISGDPSYARRRAAVGRASNDYRPLK